MNRRDFISAASVVAASVAVPAGTLAQADHDAGGKPPQPDVKLRTITLEEHFVSPGFVAGPGRAFLERYRTAGAGGTKISGAMPSCSRPHRSPSPTASARRSIRSR